MNLIDTISGIVIVIFGVFLIVLCFVMFLKPTAGKQFLLAFASSAKAHYTEMAIRSVIGVALVLHESYDKYGFYLQMVGWLILVTTVGLLLIPWQWHHKFASWVIPPVIRLMKLYSILLLISGLLLLWVV